MKRRSRQNVGAWPNMRDDTLKAVADELVRARKKHPTKANNLHVLNIAFESLGAELIANSAGRIPATQVYARAAQVAAIAIRVLEEGTADHRYAGNTQTPEFSLTNIDNDRAH